MSDNVISLEERVYYPEVTYGYFKKQLYAYAHMEGGGREMIECPEGVELKVQVIKYPNGSERIKVFGRKTKK